jgi:hypothetical protein
MLEATLWQVERAMAPGPSAAWTCRLPRYRSAKPQADRVFDSYVCEQVIFLTTPTVRRPR